jgi:hypothetical protein
LKPRLTEPRYSTRGGRTWLDYPDLDVSGLIHGIAVFKDSYHTEPYDDWARTASAFVIRNAGALASLDRLVIPRQVHGPDIRVIRAGLAGAVSDSPTCDGLVTDLRGLAIGVSVADCLPLFAVNQPDQVLGVAHCGWRGIAAGVVEQFARSLGGLVRDPGRTRYLVGAGIGRCCYQVREDLLGQFAADDIKNFTEERDGTVFLDLKQLVASRLAASGAEPAGISIDNTCTSCQKYTLSSFRRHGARSGRMLAFMAMVK